VIAIEIIQQSGLRTGSPLNLGPWAWFVLASAGARIEVLQKPMGLIGSKFGASHPVHPRENLRHAHVIEISADISSDQYILPWASDCGVFVMS